MNSVKVMEEVCCELSVQNYSSLINVGVGEAIESEAIEVGGHSFTLRFYPQGKTQRIQIDNRMSLFIKNQSPEAVEVVYAFEFMEQLCTCLPACNQFARRSQFHDRGMYRHVTTLRPGRECGTSRFWRGLIDDQIIFVRRDSIRINVTIGVFVRKPLATVGEPFDRTIFFRAGGTRFFAEESVLKMRCPALLRPDDTRSTGDVVVDVDPDVFEAVLWFIYNGKLEEDDAKVISCSRYSLYADRFAPRMLAVADQFELESLTRECRSILFGFYPTLNINSFCLPIKCALQKLWEHLR